MKMSVIDFGRSDSGKERALSMAADHKSMGRAEKTAQPKQASGAQPHVAVAIEDGSFPILC
jgi:hypothetical protein